MLTVQLFRHQTVDYRATLRLIPLIFCTAKVFILIYKIPAYSGLWVCSAQRAHITDNHIIYTTLTSAKPRSLDMQGRHTVPCTTVSPRDFRHGDWKIIFSRENRKHHVREKRKSKCSVNCINIEPREICRESRISSRHLWCWEYYITVWMGLLIIYPSVWRRTKVKCLNVHTHILYIHIFETYNHWSLKSWLCHAAA